MKKRFIYLDVDGVLNNKSTLYKAPANSTAIPINNGSLYLIRKLSIETNSHIILSSQRRFYHAWADLAREWDLPIIGQTGAELKSRGQEIQAHINQLKIMDDQYIIIDDRQDFSDNQKNRLIKTSYRLGFTKINYNDAFSLIYKAIY